MPCARKSHTHSSTDGKSTQFYHFYGILSHDTLTEENPEKRHQEDPTISWELEEYGIGVV